MIGRYDSADQFYVKIPAKWSSIENWDVYSEVVEEDFIDQYFPKLKNMTWTLHDQHNIYNGATTGLAFGGAAGIVWGGVTGYFFGDQIKETAIENRARITGTMQVAGGLLSLYAARAVGSTAIGLPLSAVISFVAMDHIQAGLRSMHTNKYAPTYGSVLLEKMGVPKGQGEIIYSFLDIGALAKASSLLKASTHAANSLEMSFVKKLAVGAQVKIKDIRIMVKQITLNKRNKIALKELEVENAISKDVVIHGSSDSFAVLRDGKWVTLDQRSLVTFIQKNNYNGESIRLISCSTGACSTSIAQDLSNKLGAKIVAPSDTIWIHSNGNMTIGNNPLINTGKWNTFNPEKNLK